MNESLAVEPALYRLSRLVIWGLLLSALAGCQISPQKSLSRMWDKVRPGDQTVEDPFLEEELVAEEEGAQKVRANPLSDEEQGIMRVSDGENTEDESVGRITLRTTKSTPTAEGRVQEPSSQNTQLARLRNELRAEVAMEEKSVGRKPVQAQEEQNPFLDETIEPTSRREVSERKPVVRKAHREDENPFEEGAEAETPRKSVKQDVRTTEDGRVQADALMARARSALRRHQFEEAYRLASAAARLESQGVARYQRGEERPSAFLARIRQLRDTSAKAGNQEGEGEQVEQLAEVASEHESPMIEVTSSEEPGYAKVDLVEATPVNVLANSPISVKGPLDLSEVETEADELEENPFLEDSIEVASGPSMTEVLRESEDFMESGESYSEETEDPFAETDESVFNEEVASKLEVPVPSEFAGAELEETEESSTVAKSGNTTYRWMMLVGFSLVAAAIVRVALAIREDSKNLA